METDNGVFPNEREVTIEEVQVQIFSPCKKYMTSEELKNLYESKDYNPNRDILLQYYFWLNICLSDCYDDSPVCCEVVIIVE